MLPKENSFSLLSTTKPKQNHMTNVNNTIVYCLIFYFKLQKNHRLNRKEEDDGGGGSTDDDDDDDFESTRVESKNHLKYISTMNLNWLRDNSLLIYVSE